MTASFNSLPIVMADERHCMVERPAFLAEYILNHHAPL